jgi:hypothetical protein
MPLPSGRQPLILLFHYQENKITSRVSESLGLHIAVCQIFIKIGSGVLYQQSSMRDLPESGHTDGHVLQRATISLIKSNPCNALLRMLPVCIGSCLMSVQRYKFLILDAYHPDTLYLRERGWENPWLSFEAKRVRGQNSLVNTALQRSSAVLTAERLCSADGHVSSRLVAV